MKSPTRTVLVVDDEPQLRHNVVEGLSRLDGVECFEASTVDEALAAIDRRTPDLILSDIDLPERSGLELLGELGRRNLRVPVVYVTAYLKAFRAQIPQHSSVEVLEKPVSLDELRAVVRRRTGLNEPSKRSELPPPFGVPDYLQLSAMGRHSVTIEVRRAGVLIGSLVMVQGELWAVTDSEGAGPAALGRLAFAKHTVVECRALRREPGERNITGQWEASLLDAAREHDEASENDVVDLAAPGGSQPRAEAPSAPTPSAPDPAGLTPPEVPDLFDELLDDAVEALLGKRYDAAKSAFAAAASLRPGHPLVEANLARLAKLQKT